MRKFLFVFASTVTLITPSVAQYGYPAPGYTVPGAPNSGPRYRWDERSAPQMPENYEKQRTPNNALSGTIGLGDPNAVGGECAKGFSEETCRRRGQKYNPPGQN
jgi:hypothetical protein